MLRLAQPTALLVLVAILLAAPSSADRSARPTTAARAWLAYGHDAQLTNFVRLPGLTSATAKRLRQVWTKKLDGQIIASPLYASGGQGGLPRARGAVFVATEGGSLYALKPSTGAVLWRRTLGTMVAASECGRWGIGSTPAIDLKRRAIYVISADGLAPRARPRDRSRKAGWPVAVTVERNDAEYVWGGLRLVGNTLYVVVASYCDAPTAQGIGVNGRIAAIDVLAGAASGDLRFRLGRPRTSAACGAGAASPSTRRAGHSSSASATLTCSTAAVTAHVDDAGYGNAMVKLSLGLRVLGWHRPPSIPRTEDSDFGSAPLLIQAPGCPPLAFANNKNGMMYVWNRDQLGKGTRSSSLLGGGTGFVGQPS